MIISEDLAFLIETYRMEDFYNSFRLHNECKSEALIEGRILLIDKPLSWSSFDLVNKVRIMIRQHLGIRKIKVGHAGTLDPLATGLMIVCIGKLTKQIDSLMGMDKEYVASVTFGATTPSYDLETEIDKVYEADHISKLDVEDTLKGFLGIQMQTPPLFSAIQINGKRAYEHARKGHDVELKQRQIEIKELELISYDKPVAVIRVVCSKGTYVRSLACDLGKALRSGAHLSGLRRTAIGSFRIEQALSIDQLDNILQEIQTN